MAKPQTDSNGKIVKRAPSPSDNLANLVQRMGPELAKALPSHVKPDRMARMALTALRTVNNLGSCSPPSFLGCLMQAAQLGIEPNTPLQHAWLIPRKNRNGGYECTLILGYQGLMELAMRSGVVSGMYSYVVREGDQFSVRLGLDPHIEHIPSDAADRESRPITYVYAVAKVKTGDPIFVCLSRAQVEARRARSDGYMYQVKKGGKSNPWFTDEEAMFQKTALRALWKWLPKSAEMARVIAVEEAAEIHARQSDGFDPEITDVLRNSGIEEDPIDTEGEPVDDDPDGENGVAAEGEVANGS